MRVEVDALADIAVADLRRVVLLLLLGFWAKADAGSQRQHAGQAAQKSHRVLLMAIINVL